MRRTLPALMALFVASSGAAFAQATPAKVDLELFETSKVDRSKGCSLALWQANRDPSKDKFAYILTEDFRGKNHVRLPAQIKIGGKVLPLQRVATGGKSDGYALYPYQLYKMPGEDGFVVLDLKLGDVMGEAIDVESGKLYIVMNGKEVFRASVLGGAGCMGAPLLEGTRASLPAKTASAPAVPKAATPSAPVTPATSTPLPPAPKMFDRYAVDPVHFSAEFRREVAKKFSCDPALLRSGVVGYSLSEESAIWQIPCTRAAYQGNSVFALVYVAAPEKEHEYLEIPAPRGRARTSDPGHLTNPKWDIKNRIVTSVALGRASGECGVLERHRVTEEGKFVLVEYREKVNCDGVVTKPDDFPLVFKR